jgi:hypothetical protein
VIIVSKYDGFIRTVGKTKPGTVVRANVDGRWCECIVTVDGDLVDLDTGVVYHVDIEQSVLTCPDAKLIFE